ncbi:MAG: hypothetical protein EA424_12055, partial [Planctomycetaceae bacterium]
DFMAILVILTVESCGQQPGAGQGLLGYGSGFAFAVLGFCFVFPVGFQRLGFADFIGGELEHGFGPVAPELFCAFDPAVVVQVTSSPDLLLSLAFASACARD